MILPSRSFSLGPFSTSAELDKIRFSILYTDRSRVHLSKLVRYANLIPPKSLSHTTDM